MSDTHQNNGYEKSDLNVKKVILFFALGVVLMVVIIIFLLDYFHTVKDDIVYEAVLQPQSITLRDLRARETEELTSYKLLDEEKGIYRIPLERAKKLLADEAYHDKKK